MDIKGNDNFVLIPDENGQLVDLPLYIPAGVTVVTNYDEVAKQKKLKRLAPLEYKSERSMLAALAAPDNIEDLGTLLAYHVKQQAAELGVPLDAVQLAKLDAKIKTK